MRWMRVTAFATAMRRMPIFCWTAARRIYDIRENRDATGFESLKDIMGRAVNDLAALANGKQREKALTGFTVWIKCSADYDRAD